MRTLSVVIPSMNGLEILREYLPGILEEAVRAEAELIVVDDCSEDGTAEMIREDFPQVKLLERHGHSAFCRAVNLGMKHASGELLMVLNNDTVPEKGSFSLLAKVLSESDDSVAAVVPAIPRPDGTDDSLFSWCFRKGLAVTGQDLGGSPYPSGACAVWKSKVWHELGGLDTRYAPIYWEDTDMGARMNSSGKTMKRVPCAVVRHVHGATMGHSSATLTLRERNRFIFMETHCSSPVQRLQTLLWLPLHIAVAEARGHREFFQGYRAWRKWRRDR